MGGGVEKGGEKRIKALEKRFKPGQRCNGRAGAPGGLLSAVKRAGESGLNAANRDRGEGGLKISRDEEEVIRGTVGVGSQLGGVFEPLVDLTRRGYVTGGAIEQRWSRRDPREVARDRCLPEEAS